MLDLYYNCFDKSGDVNYFEELKKDTDLLYLAFAEENLFDCDRPEKKDSKGKMRENDSEIHLEKIEIQTFFSRVFGSAHKKHDKREPGLFKEGFRYTGMLFM